MKTETRVELSMFKLVSLNATMEVFQLAEYQIIVSKTKYFSSTTGLGWANAFSLTSFPHQTKQLPTKECIEQRTRVMQRVKSQQ